MNKPSRFNMISLPKLRIDLGNAKERFLLQLAVILAVLFLMATACTHMQMEEAGEDLISVMIIPTERKINITQVKVYKGKEPGNFAVKGNLMKSPWVKKTPPGHVDLFIHSQQWNIKKRLSVNFSPRILRKKGAKRATFSVPAISDIRPGSMIHAAFHVFKENGNKNIFDCGLNKADPDNS